MVQGASLTLDEEGTVAAATTAAQGVRNFALKLHMRVDRPFALAVHGTDGVILFAAWIADPRRPKPLWLAIRRLRFRTRS